VIDKNKVVTQAKKFFKTELKNEDIEAIADLIFARYKQQFKKAFDVVTATFNVFPTSEFAYISSCYLPVVNAKIADVDLTILDKNEGLIQIPLQFLYSPQQITLTYGYDEECEDIETLFAELTAEYVKKYEQDLLAVKSKSDSLTAGALNVNFEYFDFSKHADIVKKYYSIEKHEAGCLI
jgi:hypothetical protein